MRLLRERLACLAHAEIDWLIYGVLCLARTELPEQSETSIGSSLLFFPHVPFANWTNLYGRTDLVKAHREALYHLVKRRGGLRRLRVPGLGYGIALYGSRTKLKEIIRY